MVPALLEGVRAMLTSSVTLVGNLASDVMLRHTAASVVANFRIAVSDGYFDRKTQAWVDRPPVYLSVSAWRSLGENCAQSLVKGQPVVVVGKLRQREYEKDGRTVVVHEVEAERVGHDLTRGQATFTRNRRGPQTAELAAGPDRESGLPPRMSVVAGQSDEEGVQRGRPGLPAA
jgi:single-strand DNA-binding protein